MPTLNWVGKDKVINHDKELPFRVLKPNKKLSTDLNSKNLLIQGDNLEALKSLMPQYYGKVKCIYIDPPYNTGNEGWVYNDKVNSPQIKAWLNKTVGPEGEDLCRHDKWLCMMYPRLKLLKDLLAEDGAIFISIDDNEQHSLRMIMDEIFGKSNFINNVIWQKKYSPQYDAKYFSDMHDFILCYSKNKPYWNRNLAIRTEKQNNRYKNLDNDPRGLWKSSDLSVKTYSSAYDYPILTPSGKLISPPQGRSWRTSKMKLEELIKDNRIYFGKNGDNVPSIKRFLSEVQSGTVPVTLWLRDEVGDNQEARQTLKQIFSDSQFPFDTPKPVRLISKILQIATNDSDIILDSFAGSGTTGQAVMELNKEDGGNRKFILVEMEKDIAENVTAKRLSKVIKGYEGAKYPEGLDEGFQYLDLNGKLYNYEGYVNKDAHYEDMAAYIYFTETNNFLDLESIKNPFIGEYNDTEYYLFFKQNSKNTLMEESLQKLNNNKKNKVIYADNCLIDNELLAKNGITFKQIPYELKKY